MAPRQTDASAAALEAGEKPPNTAPDLNVEIQRPSARSLRGLDWLNFLLADVQTGVGPFLAIYLAGHGWNEERVGLGLTIGGIAGIVAQTPAALWWTGSGPKDRSSRWACAPWRSVRSSSRTFRRLGR
jgi:hypothetical protein